MFELALIQLKDEFTKKLNILKSDLLELRRQAQEIDFIKATLETNADRQTAINFLRISQGHEAYKTEIL
jgi:hypothetical protein